MAPISPSLLGLFAGGTIVLGLPIAKLAKVSTKVKVFLNAISTGILIFLLVEITGHLIEEIEQRVEAAAVGGGGMAGGYFTGGVLRG